MSRLIIGVLLIVAAVVILVVMLQPVSESNPVSGIVESVVCQPGETLEEVLGAYQRGTGTSSGGRSVTYYCNADGKQRDVTLAMVGILAGSFVIPFLLGMIMMIAGFIGGTRKMTQQMFSSAAGPGVVVRTGLMGSTPQITTTTWSGTATDLDNLPPEQAESVRQALNTVDSLFGSMGMGQFATTPFSDADLAGRLEQLKEALDKGLITQSEYDRVRQQILDNMT